MQIHGILAYSVNTLCALMHFKYHVFSTEACNLGHPLRFGLDVALHVAHLEANDANLINFALIGHMTDHLC